MPNCILCGAEGAEIDDAPTAWSHPDLDDCTVVYMDASGVPMDAIPVDERPPSLFDFMPEGVTLKAPIRTALPAAFVDQGYAYPGGVSSGRGWSSVSTFQRCPYLWRRKYLLGLKESGIESPALAFGSIMHALLAVHLLKIKDPAYRVDTDRLRDDMIRRGVDAAIVLDAYRLFDAYRLTYPDDEEMSVLAVEHDLVDPRSGDSCRFDAIVYLDKPLGDRPAGTWVVEHKTASRFDKPTLEGWINDGEIIGQQALYAALGLHHRFGPLQGTIVNLLGKQKTPQFHRQVVPVVADNVGNHRADLRRWAGLIQLAVATDCFPRARTSCVSRYGMCSEWDHCAGGSP